MSRRPVTEYDEKVKKSVSRRLKAGAYEAELTLLELSRRTGVPEASVYNVSAGRTTFTAANLCRIADELGCSVDWILGRANEKGERHGSD